MKTIRLFIAVMTMLAAVVSSVRAQTLTTLLSFCNETNACPDGSHPSGLIKGTDGNFYGTTSSAGITNIQSTIFKITPQGTLTTLFQFTNVFESSVELSLESGGLIYGTLLAGGTNHNGAIFTITPAGTLTTIHEFSGTNGVADGTAPVHLVQGPSANNFIGTTAIGGTNNAGTVFLITSAGTLTTLHQFSGTNTVVNDGTAPVIFVTSGANFIGTTIQGGTNNDGTAFSITAGGSFTLLHEFANNVDGSEPIILAKNGANFVGTTVFGGSNNAGTAFQMTSVGAVTTFYQFSGTNGVQDGSSPGLSPVQNPGGAFFGSTSDGGTNGQGLVFTLSTSGTLTPVYEFCSLSACLDGSSPSSFALGNDGNAYGTTDGGGANDGGTVFKLDINSSGGGGGCTFALGATNASPSAAGGAATVSVITSNSCAWTAVSNDGFITVTSGSSGSGNGTVHYSVAANSSTNPVSGTMTIAGNTFTVNQAGAAAVGACTFTVKPTIITLKDKGGKKSVSIKAVGTDCAWTAVSNDSFITITAGTNGTGSGKVEITVAGNTNVTALSGTLTIAGQTVTVNQEAGGCTFKLSPKAGKFKATGGPKTVKVTPNLADCTWTAFSNDGFITITGGTNGVGKGVVSYIVSTNSTTNVLSGTMTIAGQTYTVTEAGAKP